MASLRAGTLLFNAATPGAGTISSRADNPGSSTHVALFIKNTGSVAATIVVQAAGAVGGNIGAGRNMLPEADSDWYIYNRVTGAGVDILPLTLTVDAGESVVFDLSPFAPPFLRLTATGNGATVTAYTQSITSD